MFILLVRILSDWSVQDVIVTKTTCFYKLLEYEQLTLMFRVKHTMK